MKRALCNADFRAGSRARFAFAQPPVIYLKNNTKIDCHKVCRMVAAGGEIGYKHASYFPPRIRSI
jgi:hypothetical protein